MTRHATFTEITEKIRRYVTVRNGGVTGAETPPACARVTRAKRTILGLELTYQGGRALKARTPYPTLSAEPSRLESLSCGRSGLGPADQANAVTDAPRSLSAHGVQVVVEGRSAA